MARPKSSKIFLQQGQKLYCFMWANLMSDGSILMGFPFKAKSSVEAVFDQEDGEIRPPRLLSETSEVLKISFHPSGKYKLEDRIGKFTDSIDRVTVNGPPLDCIAAPRRMLEILLPREIPPVRYQPNPRDIILDVTSFPGNKPLRCTVSCMGHKEFESIATTGKQYVDTSVWEVTNALESSNHVWTWTLRVSQNDENWPARIILFLTGPVKWGSRSSAQCS